MRIRVVPRRDFQQMEARRKQAGRLFAAGKMILAAIAGQLKVSRQSVSRWYQQWRRSGAAGLKGAGRAGRKPRFDSSQLRRIERALRQGPQAHGFATNPWTLPRVAAVIETLTGVRYHPGHVWKIPGAINWTPQRPDKQARERNLEAVKLWMSEKWPAVKKTLAAKKPGSSFKTKTVSPSAHPSVEPGRRKVKRRS